MLSHFRRKGDVETLIAELSNKELIRGMNKKRLSADELKQLGDLYLQKGDKKKAIDYLYRAAVELSRGNTQKAIAVYKKILNVSPDEIGACERIIDLLAQDGLRAEQIKYLTVLARFYESRNDIQKTTATFRKILDLDPDNATAGSYFHRGKVKW